MQSITEIKSLRSQIKAWRQQGQSIAFVPTMGNLHQGHFSLVEKAKTLADKVVVSIFVNPMQFGANEDLDKYPRTLTQDKQGLAELDTDIVFTPSVDAIYPNGLDTQSYVDVPGVSEGYCGAVAAATSEALQQSSLSYSTWYNLTSPVLVKKTISNFRLSRPWYATCRCLLKLLACRLSGKFPGWQ